MPIPIIVIICMVVVALLWGIIAMAVKSYNTPHITHYEFTDKQVLLFISEQPDGLCNAEMLASNSTLTKKEAKARLNSLLHRGLLTMGYSNSFKGFYSLKTKVTKGPYPKLSTHPFLTVRDLMMLFAHFDYRLTIQDICLATNLPIQVIAQEMKYFIKEKIIDEITQTSADGMSLKRQFYILLDPYRKDPQAIGKKEKTLDLNAKKMYERMVAGKRAR